MNTKQATALGIGLVAAVTALMLPGNHRSTRLGPAQEVALNVYTQAFQDTILPSGLLSLGGVTVVTLAAIYLLRRRKHV